MTENRIRELRRSHNMSKEALGTIINTTQQAVSKMEKDTCAISTDLLISMARYFNVTTDYILGLSDIKRDLSGQIRMNQEMDQCYDIVLRYNNLTDTNKKTLQCLLKRLEQAQLEEEEADIAEEVLKNAEDSHMGKRPPFHLSGLENLVLEESQSMGVRVNTDVFSDGKTLLKSIQSGERYGLIFIDIEMEQIDGISAARKIRETDHSVLFIYISGYDKYLKELFEVEPFRFLSKPLDKEKFRRYFKEACHRIGETEVFYQFKFNKKIQKVPLKDIVYFESRNRVVHIFLQDRSTAYFYGKLNNVEKELANSRKYFLRIHQSFLVNYDYITKMNFFNITISMNGKEMELKISEDRQKEVRRQLCTIAATHLGCDASGTAASDYTEIHNDPFRSRKQKACRHNQLVFILCFPCGNRV